MSKRFFSRAVVIAAIGLTACAPAAPATQQSTGGAAQAPQRAENQRITIGQSAIWSTLDPTSLNIGRAYEIYETLTFADPTGKEVQPLLASSWRLVNDTQWEFTLRPNSKWHNGDTVTANDVQFTFQRYLNPENRSPIAQRIPNVTGVEVTSPTTFRINTRVPEPILLRQLFDVPILPQRAVTEAGQNFRLQPVGSGPFRLREYRPDDRVVVEVFPDHPTIKPIVTEVTIRAIPEASARIAGIRARELDFITEVAPDQVESLRREGMVIESTRTGNVFGFWTDAVIPNSPTQDRRVRLALNYAIDRDAILNVIFNRLQTPASQVASQETFGFNPALRPYPRDVNRARQLLAEAGYPNGFTIQMEGRFISGQPAASIAQLVQQNLREVNINAEIVNLQDPTVLLPKFLLAQPRAPMFWLEIANRPALDASFSLTWFSSQNQDV
ncbi:MAG: ABC transporter substrate-binding protein, partial [Dehalococcoidia bacterium]|nr:ABC transporter substrate-binding protein [Dehalococcoidia bacterium]